MPTRSARMMLAAGSLLALSALPASAAQLRPSIGNVDKVQAGAEAEFESSSRTLRAANHLYYDDTIKTGPGARLHATLDDGAALTLGENAELLIDEFVYRPWSAKSQLGIAVASGAFLFVGGHIEDGKGAKVEITTPVGTLGIRGTTVWGGPIDGAYGVLVLEGEVDVTTAGGTVTLKGGEGTMIASPNAAPAAAHAWPADRTARAVGTISFKN